MEKGFSLFELLIVVVIIGMLSVFVVPMYSDYTHRTAVMGVLNDLEPLKAKVSEAIFEGKGLPSTYQGALTDETESTIAMPLFSKSKYTTAVTMSDTGIISAIPTRIAGPASAVITLTPGVLMSGGTWEKLIAIPLTAIQTAYGNTGLIWRCSVVGYTSGLGGQYPAPCRQAQPVADL
ncbi:MAG: prepilin-type N-terminal cleavage/methylation domain-containing protein [Legionellaceae bacterium]|nr:prepilin-type N-terminal cleavage/methylation domain-containing protein [Legionellaceae bacterium]